MTPCPKCGENNADDSKFCRFCGSPLHESPDGGDPKKNDAEKLSAVRRRDPDYLGWSILAAFCCSPLALVPVFIAYTSRSSFARGDFAAAAERARLARICFWVALFVGLAFNSVYIQRNWDELEHMYYDALSQETGEDDGPEPENRFDTVIESQDAAKSPRDKAPEASEAPAAPVAPATSDSDPEKKPEAPAPPEQTASSEPSAPSDSARGAAGVTVETESLDDVLKGTTP